MTLDSLIQATTPAAAEPLVWPKELHGRGHLSASQLTLFSRCPEQYRRVYVLGERRPPAGALIFGSADHKAHELNFTQKITSGADISVGDVELAFAEAFDREVNKAGGTGEVDWESDKPGELKDKGIALVGHYHRKVSPFVQPIAVEARFEITVPGVPLPIIGYVDVEEEADLIERKTAKRKESAIKPDWRLQGLLYQSVREKPVDWHLSTKTKLPAVYTPTDEPGLHLAYSPLAVKTAHNFCRAIAGQIVALFNQYGPDEPWPTGAPVYGWACGFCGFRPTCPWWEYENAKEAA